MKEMMKKMMDPSNQGSQGGSGDQPQIIEIDPSTEEGQAQLKEIMKLMKDPRHQIKQISGEKTGQNGMAKNGLSRESGMKMVGNQEKSSGTAEGSGRNYNPNAKPSAEDMQPSENHPPASWAPKEHKMADDNKLLFVKYLNWSTI